jgi:hypothetical protein
MAIVSLEGGLRRKEKGEHRVSLHFDDLVHVARILGVSRDGQSAYEFARMVIATAKERAERDPRWADAHPDICEWAQWHRNFDGTSGECQVSYLEYFENNRRGE